MKIVKVKEIPVRYNGTTYQPGEPFEMETDHVNEALVKVLGDVEKPPKEVKDMTIAEMKEYAAENDIDLGDAKLHAEILAEIERVETERDLLD